MDLLKVSEFRMKLASRLIERMEPLHEGDYVPSINIKLNSIEFGGTKDDRTLIWELFDALVGDAMIFEEWHQKENISLSIEVKVNRK